MAHLDEGVRVVEAGQVVTTGPDRPRAGIASTGLLGGLVSSLCCLPAAVAVALGLGGSSFLVGLARYRTFFVVAGLALALAATWWSLRRSQRCCPAAAHRRNQFLIPALTLGSFVISYVLINQVLLPWLYSRG